MTIVSARANLLFDSNGDSWLDLQSGILNTPFGHGSATIDLALREVLACGLVNTYDRVSLAQQELIDLMGAYQPGYTWKPFNTGAEAIEKAIQIAATYFGYLPKIAVLPKSFHGKNLSMAYANYGNKLPWGNPMDIIIIDPESDRNLDFDVLIYEPIQGWDGTVNDEDRLSELCDERDALLIADEMITGFMRCGKRFMSETADMIVCGKGISAGAPLSMLGYHKELLAIHNDTIPVGWRTTGAGNNLSMTVGRNSLELLINSETYLKETIDMIEERLLAMGFNATGALGFKKLKNHEATKSYFEEERIIGSFHCAGQVRVGPSFVTTKEDLESLGKALDDMGELV